MNTILILAASMGHYSRLPCGGLLYSLVGLGTIFYSGDGGI